MRRVTYLMLCCKGEGDITLTPRYVASVLVAATSSSLPYSRQLRSSRQSESGARTEMREVGRLQVGWLARWQVLDVSTIDSNSELQGSDASSCNEEL